MALARGEHELPNLKIEIENDLEEAMDIDDGEINKPTTIDLHSRAIDVEEGEVCENKEEDPSEHRLSKSSDSHMKLKNISSHIDGTPADVVAEPETFDGKHTEVFGVKSRKYGLTPAEAEILTEEKLALLYKSLGMKEEESIEKRYRLDALHMRGTQDMSTEDVFSYFKDYNPASIEWINDYSCNIVWINSILAAKAINELSKPIKGLEGSHLKDPFAITEKSRNRLSSETKGDIVVMVTEVEDQDGEVLMVGDEETGEEETNKGKPLLERKDSVSSKISEKNGAIEAHEEPGAVHVSEINIPIPPGFWRLGKSSPKAKQILLRFSMKTDRKPARAEKMSDYYKKHGNPNYGGIKGLITKSRKRRFKEKNPPETGLQKGNPWGSLAESWGNIDRRKAMQPEAFDRDGDVPLGFPSTVRVPLRVPGTIHMLPLAIPPAHPKMRLHSASRVPSRVSSSDPESENSDDDFESKGSSSAEWRRKIKQPRMRMYADEEEERVERRREQQRREAEVAAAVRKGAELSRISRSSSAERARESSRKKQSLGVVDLRSRLRKDNKESTRGSTSASKGRDKIKSSVWNRLANKNVAPSGSDDDEDDVEDSDVVPAKVDLRSSLSKKPFEGDLRSKLNRNKTMKQNSPLRIEIDNDEYYRVTGCDQD